ncbi:MAG: hypothetical protein LBG60_10320 [Bifidobacteriaceae bacterium]|nr:hypothetical protein [Bifidobacteriaceae bacterium]
MTNLTISVSDDVLRRVRVEAAVQGMSVSRFVGRVLEDKFLADDAYERAMTDFLAGEPYLAPPPRADGRAWPTRDEMHRRGASL